MRGISVIICCYNSEHRIVPTLQHLFNQRTENLAWEIILVNNNCTDNTVPVALKEAELKGKLHLVKVEEEPEPGLSHAREKGVTVSVYDKVLFCDDDNWLASDYLISASQIMDQHQEIAILGGHILPVFGTTEPDWFSKYSGGYAVGQQAKSELEYKEWVYGAGMVLRKEYLMKLKESQFRPALSDRKGAELTSGGDSEYCYVARLYGYKVAASSLLLMQHFIPAGRLTVDYAHLLYRGFGKTMPVLDYYKDAIKKGYFYPGVFYRFKKALQCLKGLSLFRIFFYSLFLPKHPYLTMPFTIMYRNAFWQYLRQPIQADYKHNS